MEQYRTYFKLFLMLLICFVCRITPLSAGNAYSYDFNGTDESLYISNASGLNITDHWTFETWIYVNSVSGYDDFMFRNSIFSFQVKNPLGSGDFALDFYNRDNGAELSTDASNDLTFNTWYHVAVTFEGTTAKLWVNENMVDSDNNAANWILNTNSENFNIGARYISGYSNYFDGQIDELRISDIARSEYDMQTAYRTESYTVDANTLLLMHFDDRAGTPTYLTGTSFSGTVHNHNTGTSNYKHLAVDTAYLLQPKYRTKSSGNWTDASTWQYYDGSSDAWEDATLYPDYHNDTITLMNGDTLTVDDNITADEIIINSGGELDVPALKTLTLNNGDDTDLDVYGILKKSGVILRNSGATIVMENGGKYQHDTDGPISTATWETGSTCEVIGVGTGTTTLNLGHTGQMFHHFIWNVPTQSCDVVMEDFTDTYGDFKLENTNGHQLIFHNSSSDKQVNIGGTGNCYINGGTLNINAGSGDCYFVIYNDYIQTGGTVTATGSGTGYFRFGPLYVVHSGTFTKTGGVLTPDDFQVNRRYTLTLASDFDAGNVPFTLHGKMTVPTGYTFDFDSTFLIKSLSGYNGSLINKGTVTSEIDVECYFTSARWHGISAPVTNLTAGDFYLGGNPDVWMLRYNEDTNNYTFISDTNTQLGDMHGWFIWLGGSNNHTFTFHGVPRTGTVGTDNNMIRTSDTTGFNFVGNPFTSAINWESTSGWTKTNLDDAIYLYKDGNWATYVNGAGTNGGSAHIAMNQGFFVRVTDNGNYPAYGTLKMNADVCIHSDTAFMKKSSPAEQQLIRLQIDNGLLSDETVIRFTPQASPGWDGNLDARKLFSFNDSMPQIYSVAQGVKLSVNSLPPETEMIPLGIRGKNGQTLTVSLTQKGNFNKIFLKDRVTDSIINLTADHYTFTFTHGSPDRFFLSFLPLGTSQHTVTTNEPVVFAKGKTIKVIIRQNIPSEIMIYDLLGRKQSQKKGGKGRYTFNIPTAGYYIAVVTNKNGRFSKKIPVR